MSSNSTYLIPKIPFRNHFFVPTVVPYRFLILVFFLIQIATTWSQTGVEITSTESSPTQNQNIPINIKFNQPVNLFQVNDILVTNGSLSNFNIETPDYNWLTSYDVDQFNVGIGDIGNPEAKTNRVVISTASNSKGEIFVLTFGNGIFRINPDGSKSQIINGNNLESPLDFAINKEDKFFVADNGQARQIKVFSPTGAYLSDENIGNGNAGNSENNFYGPVGLTFDKDGNLYVADSYSGSDTSEFDRYSIKIYYTDGGYKRLIRDPEANKEIFNPYRVAVDNAGNIYVSDSGGENGRVIVFGPDYKYVDTLEGGVDKLGSPGSIVIDDYGYIYVANLGDEVSITQLLNAEDDPEELLEVFPLIRDGIKNNEFDINVYDSNRNYLRTISDKIDLPVDLGLDPCGKLFVNNAIFDGNIGSLFGVPIPDIDLDFDIEVYNRLPKTFTANLKITEECTPAKLEIAEGVAKDADCNINSSSDFQIIWDQTKPEISTCVSEKIITANNSGEFQLEDYRFLDEFLYGDNCDIIDDLIISQTPVSGTKVAEDTEVTLKLTDKAGNFQSCSFLVKLTESSNTPPKFTDCPTSNIIKNTDPGECGAVVTFAPPKVEDDNGEIVPTRIDSNSELSSGNLFPVGETVITFQADDGVNDPVECSFTIVISDEQDPVITNCPPNIDESVAFGETGKVIDYSLPTFSDNCGNAKITQTNGVASGEEFPLGTTTNIFVIDDGNGNTSTCSFNVVITEETEDSPPKFTDCPTSVLQLNNDSGECGAMVSFNIPTVTDDGGTITPIRTDDSGLNSGELFPVGATVITFQADDGVNNPVECSFTIIVKDAENPVITNCINPNLNINLAEGETFQLPDYGADLVASDNCDQNLEITQEPVPGTAISQTTQVVIQAVDDAGNFDTCEFTIEVTRVEGENLVLNCPADYEVIADENCQFTVPNFSEVLSFSPPEANIEQSIAAGSELTSNQVINITATYEGQVETCDINLILKRNTELVVNCPADKEAVLSINNIFTLPDYTSEVNVSDYCGEIDIVQTPAPNTNITADSVISFEVMDSFGNSATCNFNLELIPAGSLIINCPADKILSKNENCAVILPDFTTEAEVINGDGIEVTQNPLPGTLISEDTVEIILTVENNESSESCSFNINLVDDLPPNLILKDVVISLDTNGEADLNSQDINDGSFDNCSSQLQFFLEKSNFSCDELGENIVEIGIEDGNGNESTSTVVVTVVDPSGICAAIEEPETEYLFVYPNPTQGEVRFAVPKDMNIFTVFVYDSRGRFIFEKSYDRERPNYQLDLSGLQDAIYFLKLFTSKGQLTERVILRSQF